MKTQIREKNGITILEPNGKIMGNSVSEFKKTIAPQIEASNKPRILINLEGVDKMDSSGLGVLIGAYAAAAQKQGRIGIIHVGKNIKNLIVISRLVRLFEHFDTEEAAVSALAA
jgi:anti-sigma B factor antagonist